MEDRERDCPQPPEHRPPRAGEGILTLSGCENGHVFFFPHPSCPSCGAPLKKTLSPADAILVSHTTVRVGPAGTPFVLGLVRVACGAQTLCIIDGDAPGDEVTRVVVEERDGLYHAKPKIHA